MFWCTEWIILWLTLKLTEGLDRARRGQCRWSWSCWCTPCRSPPQRRWRAGAWKQENCYDSNLSVRRPGPGVGSGPEMKTSQYFVLTCHKFPRQSPRKALSAAARMFGSRAGGSWHWQTPRTDCGSSDIPPWGPGPGCWPGWSGSWPASLCLTLSASCPGWSCTSPPRSWWRRPPPAAWYHSQPRCCSCWKPLSTFSNI